MIVEYCDKCGADIRKNDGINKAIYVSVSGCYNASRDVRLMLCQDCFREFAPKGMAVGTSKFQKKDPESVDVFLGALKEMIQNYLEGGGQW